MDTIILIRRELILPKAEALGFFGHSIMRFSNVKNVSNRNVTIRQPSGAEFMLTPGNSVGNVSVINLHEVSAQVKVTHDITEVIEPVRGKVKLND